MLALVTAIFFMLLMIFFIVLRHWSGSWCSLHYLRAGLASDCCAGCAAKRGTENRAILPAHVVTHCSTGRAAERAADYRAAIHGIGIHTGRKK